MSQHHALQQAQPAHQYRKYVYGHKTDHILYDGSSGISTHASDERCGERHDRPSRTDEPAAHDGYRELSDAAHARRRHPGRLRLGLHRLALAAREKSGAGKRERETHGEREESVCEREKEGGRKEERARPELSALPEAGGSRLIPGASKNIKNKINSAGEVLNELKETPVVVVFLGNETKKKKQKKKLL